VVWLNPESKSISILAPGSTARPGRRLSPAGRLQTRQGLGPTRETEPREPMPLDLGDADLPGARLAVSDRTAMIGAGSRIVRVFA